MSAAQRFLTQRIIPLKEKKSRAEVEREVVKGIKDKNYPRNALMPRKERKSKRRQDTENKKLIKE